MRLCLTCGGLGQRHTDERGTFWKCERCENTWRMGYPDEPDLDDPGDYMDEDAMRELDAERVDR